MALSPTAEDTLDQWLTAHPQWQVNNGKLCRSLQFNSFVAAFGFMTQVALLAENQDHHPEWFNVYNRVDIALTTHDVGAISERDLKLAESIDALSAKLQR